MLKGLGLNVLGSQGFMVVQFKAFEVVAFRVGSLGFKVSCLR